MLYSIKLYLGVTTSKSSSLSINALLIFETQEIKRCTIFKCGLSIKHFISICSISCRNNSPSIIRSNQINQTNNQSLNNSNFSCYNNICITVISWIWSWHWCFKSYLFTWFVSIFCSVWLITNFYPFLVINLGTLSDVVSSRLVTFWYYIFIWY